MNKSKVEVNCPNIIAASCKYPSGFFESSSGYSQKYARFESDTMLIEPTLEVAKNVLQKGKVDADQVDLIVTLCLSSDHLAYDSAIGGPRLCHPLQNELKAKNAWVFDMTDSSLVTTLQVVHTYLTTNHKKYALIVRAENSIGVSPDILSGFSLSDGVGALLIENSNKKMLDLPSLAYFQNSSKDYTKKYKPCIVTWNDKIEDVTDIKGIIKFEYQKQLLFHISKDISNLALDHKILYDGWFFLDKESFSQHTKDGVFLGPLLPFYELSKVKSCDTYQVISFNPFSLELQSFTIGTILQNE